MNQSILNHPVLLIAIPLLIAFVAGLLYKIPLFRKGWLPTFVLGLVSAFAFAILINSNGEAINELIVIKAPLGINIYGGPFALLFIGVTSLLTITLTASPKMRRYFSDSIQSNVLFILHLAGINGLFLSGDIFNLFVFLEIASLSAYALTVISDSAKSFEAGIKYILVGSISSILLLVGIALIYKYTGTLNLAELSQVAPLMSAAVYSAVLAFILIPLLIEAEVFPFNLWSPDIYEGSGAAVSGIFSALTLKAMIYLLFRIVITLAPSQSVFTGLMWLGLISMVVAELGALKQKNLVRMLAYSSIAQAGLIIAAFSLSGLSSSSLNSGVVIALISHSAAKAGLFLIASLVLVNGSIYELKGIGQKNRVIGGAFIVLTLSLLGLPPFSGFIGKFLILKSFAITVGSIPVALILISAVIEAWYLLKLISIVFSREDNENTALPMRYAISLIIPIAIIIILGVAPKMFSKQISNGTNDITNSIEYNSNVLGGGLHE